MLVRLRKVREAAEEGLVAVMVDRVSERTEGRVAAVVEVVE